MFERELEKLDKRMRKTKREIHIADDFKVFEEVFDRSTLLTLHGFINKKLFNEVCGTIATGKEANVYLAKDEREKEFAIKIFRVATTDFKRKWNYLVADPRFSRTRHGSRSIIFSWARREYANLRELAGKINVPRAIDLEKNVLVMEFLGKKGIPYPRLKEVGPSFPEAQYREVLEVMRRMYENGFVHSDLSEYNILAGDKLYFIDFAQATIIKNPNFEEYLLRDIFNINRFFEGFTDVLPDEDVLKFVKGERSD